MTQNSNKWNKQQNKQIARPRGQSFISGEISFTDENFKRVSYFSATMYKSALHYRHANVDVNEPTMLHPDRLSILTDVHFCRSNIACISFCDCRVQASASPYFWSLWGGWPPGPPTPGCASANGRRKQTFACRSVDDARRKEEISHSVNN